MGFRCGYVGVPSKHKLYNVDFMEDCIELNMTQSRLENKNIENWELRTIEEILSPISYFNVHGGLTYSGFEVFNDEYWGFGYDCGHFQDGRDLDTAYKYGLLSKEQYCVEQKIQRDLLYFSKYTIIRDLDYCINECKSLAEQLDEVGYYEYEIRPKKIKDVKNEE